MAVAGTSSMKLCDFTRCSICLETIKEPKALPCIHTFCLECLDKHCEDKGQTVPCPLCRKLFTVPPGGNKDLPNNFFIVQALQNKQSTENCENDSSSIKRLKSSVDYCEQHPSEPNSLYCYDCKMVACPACIKDKHRKHDLIDVNESAEMFKQQLKDDVDSVTACPLKKLKCIKRLDKAARHFTKEVISTQNKITKKCDQLIYLIQSHKNQMIGELDAFKDYILKEVDSEKDEIERHFKIRESFTAYVLEMLNKGTACDISRAAHDLHDRTEELLNAQDKPACHRFSGVEITFKPSLSATDTVKNFIGELVIEDEAYSANEERKCYQEMGLAKFLVNPTLLHVMPGAGKRVSGITVLGGEVFVVRGTSEVYVYKSDDFTLIRSFNIIRSSELRELVSCSHYNCLYVCDGLLKIIYKYDLTSSVTTKWRASTAGFTLSVTKCYNVFATHVYVRRIQEFTTHGILVREIRIDKGIDFPYHTVQLSTGYLVVSSQLGQVSVVDQGGHTIHSYDGCLEFDSDSEVEESLEEPYYPFDLAVDTHDNVLVADSNSNTVLLLSPTLSTLGCIDIPGHQLDLNLPYLLHFDPLNNRLYIVPYADERMFVLGTDIGSCRRK